MGLYLLAFPLDSLDLRVVPGQNQYERFRKRFEFTLKDKCKNELKARGKQFNDYGSHSMRKRATSYYSNGTSQCPPIVAINLRGGWSMGTIQDTYMRYKSAGDMFVGRTACGLPPTSREFCILPTHFINNFDLVMDIIKECIPNATSTMTRVCMFVLASVVYHLDFLKTHFESIHFIFKNSLFSDTARLQVLYRVFIVDIQIMKFNYDLPESLAI